MKNVIILGSTGSLGLQAIEVLEKYKKDFKIIGLSTHKNQKLLKAQAKKLKIPFKNVVLTSKQSPKFLTKLIKLNSSDIIINVLPGTSGIQPTKTALKEGKIVLLGNKESLVAEGREIMKIAKNNLIPLDSEHNAIFEILKKFPNKKLKKIILPCSGGPFLGKTQGELAEISSTQALSHPKWKMGKKISIESASLLNKGLEIIEAHFLFSIPFSKIAVKIHPECKIHGIVEFEKETYGYISKPDMREHIENAILHCINKKTPGQNKIKILNPEKHTLKNPDHKTFPGIKIVLENFKRPQRSMKSFLKKEENTIQKFLDNKINFLEIFKQLQQR